LNACRTLKGRELLLKTGRLFFKEEKRSLQGEKQKGKLGGWKENGGPETSPRLPFSRRTSTGGRGNWLRWYAEPTDPLRVSKRITTIIKQKTVPGEENRRRFSITDPHLSDGNDNKRKESLFE